MEKDVIDILERRKSNYSNIVVYVFDTKKAMIRFRNKNKCLNKDILLTTVDEIRDYKLEGYKIKEYITEDKLL